MFSASAYSSYLWRLFVYPSISISRASFSYHATFQLSLFLWHSQQTKALCNHFYKLLHDSSRRLCESRMSVSVSELVTWSCTISKPNERAVYKSRGLTPLVIKLLVIMELLDVCFPWSKVGCEFSLNFRWAVHSTIIWQECARWCYEQHNDLRTTKSWDASLRLGGQWQAASLGRASFRNESRDTILLDYKCLSE